ncbi:hypothetical protein [Acetanaerobacterium elongatum]|uniref:Uncharacterized protein n=1 Tax=Acetanaerobacterium elongatum TaxID=258515 RepID=A0A1G9XUH0_9FIRM|nr:hypothetical protein [Acetanaerobacterium elongatum]SDM99815.1 hypothetical protein SAMN05192585_10934 [Acetanaerobacterium elongatum]
MVWFVVAVFALIGFTETPALIQKKMWRELVVFSVLFVFSFVVCLLYAMGVDVPSPIRGIKYLLENVLKLTYR